ncbi:Protein MB21D2 [Habropoda laboriosa]|uniref:Protein MB21D2 n=1 Tax=Habropoda laboriosa TaxID=597456 RepID=A0A0L7R6W5_9HYME|nr:PREDICTED: uncharacterized protein LOC108571278 [Habropoda laboriosa]KOC66588.1 Protein MB21D2 [Habropoda laboriosa]
MGNSKIKPPKKASGKNVYNGQHEGAGTPGSREEEYTDKELFLLRRAIQRNPEMFILNNLMMCVQFFGNYEQEIKHVKESLVSSYETEMNKRLPTQRHVLLPDILQEHIAKNVGFTSTRQNFLPIIEPLQPVRIYMVHENVDVLEQYYSPHYSSVNDSVTYTTLLKPTKHQGYVQLQLVDETGTSKKMNKEEDEIDLSSIAEDDDELYSDGDSIYGPNLSDNTTTMSGRVPKHSLSKSSKSLPNLCDEGISSVNRSATKAETDYEYYSSYEERRRRTKRAWSKQELSKREKVSPQSKTQESTQNQLDQASNNSSGYRSDNYATNSGGSSSYNPTQNSRFSSSSEVAECWRSGEFPNRCFKKVTYTAEGKLYDPREEKMYLMDSKQRRIKLALKRHNYDLIYMSSTEFMKHFTSMFVHRWAESLGFDRESVEDVRREGCVLHCDKVMISRVFKHSRVEQYQIIPAIWLQWPNCAEEWLDRSRNTWPDFNDIEKVKDFGCYVVPEGFVPKKGNSNAMMDFEWQLTFPAAERYLETCLTHAQAQVYLVAQVLHKTYMRPIFDTMFSLTTAHIRHKLFWMIEEDERQLKWPENRMGECLLKLLDSLYISISQYEPVLRDYFVKERNLLQHIPSERSYLLSTQKQLKRIKENLVMYVFHAMENIQYRNDLFPKLDYEQLLKILTADTLSLANPTLMQHISRAEPRKSVERGVQDETHKTLINPNKDRDSVVEILVRCADLDIPRLCSLLNFFITHFIKIAECCNHYQAHRQKTIYLDHADRLAILLFEQELFKDEARAYRDKIKVLRLKTASSKSANDPPDTPKRNAETPIFVVSLKDRFGRNVHPSKGTSNRKEEEEIVTKAIVHEESHYEEPYEERILNITNSKLTTTTTTSEVQLSEVKSHEQEQILQLPPSPNPTDAETTYI